MRKRNNKGVVAEYLPWMLIALVLLVLVIISIFFLKQEGVSLIEQIKDVFRRR